MNLKYGIAGVLVSGFLAMPLTAQADRDKDESGQGNCYEHKGKLKCQGNARHKEKQKHKSKREVEYEYEGEQGYSAGGPPPWAPAHGWRRKHEGAGQYAMQEAAVVVEHAGTQVVVSDGAATVDVGIVKGTCNRDAIGTVLGGIIGGAIGNRVGDRENRKVSTVLGMVIGGVVGHKVGSSMDKADQHCSGQVLEQAADNQTVRWADHNGGGQYSMTPLRTYQANGMNCRDYLTEYRGTNGIEQDRSTACRNADGAWSKLTM